MTWAENIIQFMEGLHVDEDILPSGIEPLYPLQGEYRETTRSIVEAFYHKYYGDNEPRQFIIGINPGRLGAGLTGIPFTDTKRLADPCGIEVDAFSCHEVSSVFIYEMIAAYGGPEAFYRKFYITSVSPIGFVKEKKNGKAVNYNYYDEKSLERAITPFVIEQMETQLNFGADRRAAYVLGSGKNFKYFERLNREQQFFDEVIALEHPRYVLQYKNRFKQDYIDKYLRAFQQHA